MTKRDCWRWLQSRACPLLTVCSGKGKADGVGVLAACIASVILLTVRRRKLGMAGEVTNEKMITVTTDCK